MQPNYYYSSTYVVQIINFVELISSPLTLLLIVKIKTMAGYKQGIVAR